MKKALVLVLLMAAPASAHGLRIGLGEYRGEVLRAGAQARLCDPEDFALAEAERRMANQRFLADYQRYLPAQPTTPRSAAPIGSIYAPPPSSSRSANSPASGSSR
jgi:hypothetical protein